MQLKDYRIDKGLTREQAALQLKVSLDVYISWETSKKGKSKRIPREENMKKIVEWSEGQVSPNDFYNLEQAD